MTALAILTLILAIGCFAIRELYYQNKLKWTKDVLGFWGTNSWARKYKSYQNNGVDFVEAPSTWYYKFNSDLKYKEKFPLSGTLLVSLTDGPHHFQFWMFNFLSLSVTFFYGWNWWTFGAVMIGVRLANWGARKLFSR